MAEISEEKSKMPEEDEDLEDGEIEDDEEDDVQIIEPPKPIEPMKAVEKESSSHHKRKSSPESHHSNKKSPSSARKEKPNQDEDDFMTSIENALAAGLKRSGIEPPMPSVKKQVEEPEQDRRQSRNNRKRVRKRKKDRKDQKRDSSSRKRTKVNDNDMFYMVGGSPSHHEQSGSESEDGSSGSSYESEEYRRLNYEERRSKRREKYGPNRDRERERERERDKDRDRKDKKIREEKEVCLRFSEYGHCPDDDCPRAHEVRQPKKMELCKFWLMECCAKKDKCSYMHGDFPCKYYYLGLKCVNKDCKFMHGRPLSDNIKQILLKHLDTAPKEILGDFPRYGRENATKMIAQTHVKLCQEFNVPLPENEKEKSTNKIPSLLEMNIKPPNFKNDKRSNKNSRWPHKEPRSPSRDSPQSSSSAPDPPAGPGDVVLGDLRGILTEKQVENMAAIGVTTVNHINNLTVAQLNELGLSLATIGEIQATAMNMGGAKIKEEEIKVEIKEEKVEDMDFRQPPPSLENLDVDMRVVPTDDEPQTAKSPDTIMSPNQSEADEVYKKPEPPQRPSSSTNVLMSPPSHSSLIDYSQYLKDSNLNNDDEEENEPGLSIDETYCTSDYEQEDKKGSQSEDDHASQDEAPPKFELPLLPPSFDTTNFFKTNPPVKKIDISSSVSLLMDSVPKPSESPSPSRDPRMRDPRMPQKTSPAQAAKDSPKISEISSPTYRDPRQAKLDVPRRGSIYEIESPSEDEDLIKIDKDKDMRLLPFLRDSENGDVDLRFPFTPMANYVPATEIEASFGTYIFETYEVKVVEIPKPDYSDIKKSFRQSENTQDPRLKKLCGLLENLDASSASTAAKTGLPNILPIDPRKRKQQEKDETPAGPKKLQISMILQNSKHYNELSSSQKMVVNDILAELSRHLKLFQVDPTPNKIFDSSFITQRPNLQQILIGLGVYVNADGEFEEVKDMPMVTMPNIHHLPPPIMTNLPPPSLLSLSQPPPSFVGANMRPGLLGNAPNLPPFGNFDPQDSGHHNFPPIQFGDQFNQRGDFGGVNHNNNRRDQRQQNSGFRNNNNNRNNNYPPRHRRN